MPYVTKNVPHEMTTEDLVEVGTKSVTDMTESSPVEAATTLIDVAWDSMPDHVKRELAVYGLGRMIGDAMARERRITPAYVPPPARPTQPTVKIPDGKSAPGWYDITVDREKAKALHELMHGEE